MTKRLMLVILRGIINTEASSHSAASRFASDCLGERIRRGSV